MQVKFTNSKHTKVRDKELEYAKSWGASDRVLGFLFTINVNAMILRQVNRYLEIQIPYYGEEACLQEVLRCLEIYTPNDKYLIYYLIPSSSTKDVLFGSRYKNLYTKCTFPSAGENAWCKRNLLFNIIKKVQDPELIRLLFKLLDEKNMYYLSRISPNLLKDFCKNKENSYVYHSISKNINTCVLYRYVNDDDQRNALLEKYLDVHFEMIENGIAYKLLQMSFSEIQLELSNPVIKTLAKKYIPSNKPYGFITTLSEARCRDLAAVLNGSIASIQEPNYSLKASLSSMGWLNIILRRHNSFTMNREGKGFIEKENKELCIAITPDKQYFMSSIKHKRLVPLSIKKIREYYHMSDLFKDFFELLFECEAEENYFAKDILDNVQNLYSLLPGTLNEMLQHHNKKEYILSKYKDSGNLKIAYNKISLGLSYMLIKSYRYIDNNSLGILQNIRNEKLVHFTAKSWSENVNVFLQNYYIDKFHVLDSDLQLTIYDWIAMKRQMHEKIPLTKNGMRKIMEDHDRLANYIAQKRYSKEIVKVPKNTKFAKLRKLLPKEFEWIKTRKRLNYESAMQHHCVWSYGTLINNDKSAIYSYVDKTGEYTENWNGGPVRYTIEFRCHKGKYMINQIQAKHNAFSSEKLRIYLKSILENENSKEIS